MLWSFLDQVGSEESSCVPSSPPAAPETSSSDADVPAVGHTNITDLINQSYEVRRAHISSLRLILILNVLIFCTFYAMILCSADPAYDPCVFVRNSET